jgi:hypothetical protein
MTGFLFDNPAFPIVSDPNDIVGHLTQDFVKAVVFRDPEISAYIRTYLSPLITATEAPADFSIPSIGFLGASVTACEIEKVSTRARINIMREDCNKVAQIINTMSGVFTRVMKAYVPQIQPKHKDPIHFIETDILPLFRPRGAEGFAPTAHVDNKLVVGHMVLALAPLDIYMDPLDDQFWWALDDRTVSSYTRERIETLERLSDSEMSGYSQTVAGDLVFMKGFWEYDESNRDLRHQVCAHRSSKRIKERGQASIHFAPSYG